VTTGEASGSDDHRTQSCPAHDPHQGPEASRNLARRSPPAHCTEASGYPHGMGVAVKPTIQSSTREDLRVTLAARAAAREAATSPGSRMSPDATVLEPPAPGRVSSAQSHLPGVTRRGSRSSKRFAVVCVSVVVVLGIGLLAFVRPFDSRAPIRRVPARESAVRDAVPRSTTVTLPARSHDARATRQRHRDDRRTAHPVARTLAVSTPAPVHVSKPPSPVATIPAAAVTPRPASRQRAKPCVPGSLGC
jgi:hypothetical protein